MPIPSGEVITATVVGIQGPAGSGAPGSTWRNGSGAPSNSLGLNGDYYWNTATGDVYLKSTGTYSNVGSILGKPGSQMRTGTGAPSNSLGIDGDVYLNTTNGDVYAKASGAYALSGNIRGPQGAAGATGATGAAGAAGATGATGATGPAGKIYGGPLRINALGDSISVNGAILQPTTLDLTNIQAWQASAAYAVGNVRKNNGLLYYVVTAGTNGTGSGPTASVLTEGTVTWGKLPFQATKGGGNYLTWAELFSGGSLVWDMSQGYFGTTYGMIKAIVVNGGANYTNPTINFNNGSAATVQTSGGVITGITITDPGYGTSFNGYTLSDPTGSGAVISIVADGGGTFGVPGCKTADMVARLPDVVASSADIIVVLGGTNDANAGIAPSLTIANLQTCYETLHDAGKIVVAVPIPARSANTSTAINARIARVNRWIRSYCRKQAWANPTGRNIILADPTGMMVDGTQGTYYPIGGSANGAGAMTVDGLHPSQLGAEYIGLAIWQALQGLVAPAPAYSWRPCSQDNGFDPTYNPGGNLLEGLPWQSSTAVALGANCSNGGNVYYCKTAGTTASSGGPTGTGTNITDGTAVWSYSRKAGLSVMASGTAGTNTAATGVTFTGTPPTGLTFQRQSGDAAGSVTHAIESPWSNGQPGQRLVTTFSLGGATSATELWKFTLPNSAYALYGLTPADLGVTPVVLEWEIEATNRANITNLQAYLYGDIFQAGTGPSTNGAGARLLASAGAPIAWPNGDKLILRTQPMILPAALTTLSANLLIGFDASGAAGSATATVKTNFLGIHKAGVA